MLLLKLLVLVLVAVLVLVLELELELVLVCQWYSSCCGCCHWCECLQHEPRRANVVVASGQAKHGAVSLATVVTRLSWHHHCG